MLKIGYLGPEGTFSEEAGTEYKKKVGAADFIPFSTFHDILFAVHRGRIDEGIVPIENSVEGTINIVPDMLMNEVKLQIRQEIVIPVTHYLLAKKNIPLSKITEVLSHPQIIDQCKGFLRKKMPKAKIRFTYSSGEACRQVSSSMDIGAKGNLAAISTWAAARLYKLKVLKKQVNDYPGNSTRFVVLSKKDHPRTGNDKTSLAFSILKDRPGGLHDILGEFATRGINLTKIESRPTKKTLGDYYFFIDMQGHRTDKKITDAIAWVKRKASQVKVLGSYPNNS